MQAAIEKVKTFSKKVFHMHCWYCGVPIQKLRMKKNIKSNQPEVYWNIRTADHIVARSNGGGKKDNLVPACMRCNVQKINLQIEEFRIIFFGVHGGKFWGEELAQNLDAAILKIPDPIQLNNTTNAIENYERDINKLDQFLLEAMNIVFFEKVFQQK